MSMQAFSMASTHTRWTAIVKLAHLYMAFFTVAVKTWSKWTYFTPKEWNERKQ